MARQRILLTGHSGNLGQEILRELNALDAYEVVAPTHQQFDLAASSDVMRGHLDQFRPEIIINTAAYTNVDGAEDEKALARTINGDAVETMAQWASENQSYVVHFSTDYVFDGEKQSPYTPDDETNPLGYYGHSKLLGEMALRDILPDASLILRVSWLFGRRSAGFVDFLIQSARQNKPVKAVCDQTGTPTWTHSIAQRIPQILEEQPTGCLHATSQGGVSRLEQARFIYDALGISLDNIAEANTADFFQKAQRPAYTVMASCFSAMPTWQEATLAYLETVRVSV